MVVLKRIHIKNFRSIVDATIELDDFNFFVGKNDSGKSNVLKAINLFFNERTDYDTPFNFAVDYSKFAKRSIHQAKEIMIALDVQMPATFKDGGIKAQLGTPDMRLPIQYAITYPNRLPIKNSKKLSFKECSRLDFEEPDMKAFKGLKLAFTALEMLLTQANTALTAKKMLTDFHSEILSVL